MSGGLVLLPVVHSDMVLVGIPASSTQSEDARIVQGVRSRRTEGRRSAHPAKQRMGIRQRQCAVSVAYTWGIQSPRLEVQLMHLRAY